MDTSPSSTSVGIIDRGSSACLEKPGGCGHQVSWDRKKVRYTTYGSPNRPTTQAGRRAHELCTEPMGPLSMRATEGHAPLAAVVAERRRSAMRFSDFWIAPAPLRTQAIERRCAS